MPIQIYDERGSPHQENDSKRVTGRGLSHQSILKIHLKALFHRNINASFFHFFSSAQNRDFSTPYTMAPGWIPWVPSEARKILMEDLLREGPLYQKDHLSEEFVWQWYSQQPGFENVVFSQFKARLKTHRKQFNGLHEFANRDAAALEYDRRLYPRASHNARGERVFDMSAAKELLRQDVKDEKHLQMTTSDLWGTKDEYKVIKLSIFSQRVYQEVRRKKFLHFLDLKRQKLRSNPSRPVPNFDYST